MSELEQLLILAKDGNKAAKDRLVTENTGLVWSIVRRFTGRGYEAEDLFQIGVIGLIKAIDYFDLSYQVRFSTYAVPMIQGEIKRFLRDDGMLKVSRGIKDHAYKLNMARELLSSRLQREPTLMELMAETGLSRENIVMALEAHTEIESIYKVIYQGDGNEMRLMDKLEEKNNPNERVLNRMFIKQLMETLKPMEQELIRLRYFENQTQSKIAESFGISQVQVSRMEKRILKQLRSQV